MASERDIAHASSLLLDRLGRGIIMVENDRELHSVIGADKSLSIKAVKTAMSRLIRSQRVRRPKRTQPEERGMGSAKIVYELRRSS